MTCDVQTIIIGAGVIGLSIARELAMAGHEVVILEAASRYGEGISSRSSEVIHAGLYYPPGSLKARLCLRGRKMLYAYCRERGIDHRRTGKLVTATAADQIPRLRAIAGRATENGVEELTLLDARQARNMEPALHCHGALHVPVTGIVDSHGLMTALLGDAENHGAVLSCASRVLSLSPVTGGIRLDIRDKGSDMHLTARNVVIAAGLEAPALTAGLCAAGGGGRQIPRARYAKGNYFAYMGQIPFGRLIYPLPEPGGLGIHLTLDLGGQARFGPDVQWISTPDYAVDESRRAAFLRAIRAYWPDIDESRLQPAYAGIRPKIVPEGAEAADFAVWGPQELGIAGAVALLGIESPGLTASLAIAGHVRKTMMRRGH